MRVLIGLTILPWLFLSSIQATASGAENCIAYLGLLEKSCATCKVTTLNRNQAQLWTDSLEDLGYIVQTPLPHLNRTKLKKNEILVGGLYSIETATGQTCRGPDPYQQSCSARLNIDLGFLAQPLMREHSRAVCGNGSVSDFVPCDSISDMEAIPACPFAQRPPEHPALPTAPYQDKQASRVIWAKGSPNVSSTSGIGLDLKVVPDPFSFVSEARVCEIANSAVTRCEGYGCPSYKVIDQSTFVVCRDRQSGKEIWRRPLSSATYAFHQFWTKRMVAERSRQLFDGAVTSIGNWLYFTFETPTGPREEQTFTNELVNATTGKTAYKFSGFGLSSAFLDERLRVAGMEATTDLVSDQFLISHYRTSKLVEINRQGPVYVSNNFDELIDLRDSVKIRRHELGRGESIYDHKANNISYTRFEKATVVGERLYYLPQYGLPNAHTAIAVDLKTGQILWKYNNASIGFRGIRTWGETVYLTGIDLTTPFKKEGVIIGLDSMTGTEKWLNNKDLSPLFASGDFLFANSYKDTMDGYAGGFALTIHGIDVPTGIQRWRTQVGFGHPEAKLLDNGTLYLSVAKILGMSGSTDTKTVVAIDGASGRVLWSQYLGTESSHADLSSVERLRIENGLLKVRFDINSPPVFLDLKTGERYSSIGVLSR